VPAVLDSIPFGTGGMRHLFGVRRLFGCAVFLECAAFLDAPSFWSAPPSSETFRLLHIGGALD